jgi:hypothetical protein
MHLATSYHHHHHHHHHLNHSLIYLGKQPAGVINLQPHPHPLIEATNHQHHRLN